MDHFLGISAGEGLEVYLKDESRKTGRAETISFPVSSAEVKRIMEEACRRKTCVTVQGSRTGVAAGAVPLEGHILNLERMNKVTGLRFDEEKDAFFITVQPGLILLKLREMTASGIFETEGWDRASLNALEHYRQSGFWFFPPDPTETSASIGGMVSCNSSGACSYFYGPARDYTEALDIVLPDGSVIFGHIGDNHVHVNILPRTPEDYEAGRELYLRWAGKVTGMGGTISAEHGVGKLKIALLEEMYGNAGVAMMRDVKKVFDSDFILNRGNLFTKEKAG